MPALGERFRAAREARGLSLSDVSEQIRIRSLYLAAIEEENWSVVGAPVYVRGFLRTYARFLGLDPEEVVAAFNALTRGSEAAPSPSPPQPIERPSNRGTVMLWIAGGIAVLLIAFVVYNELTMTRTNVPVAVSTGPTSPVTALGTDQGGAATPSSGASPAGVSPSPTAQAGGGKSLGLVLSAPSWLRVTVDGNVSMEGTFAAGTAKTFHGKNALVRIGNAGGVEIYVDGKDVGKLGKSGDVAERAFTL